jgi:predicted nucleotidyltransferase
MVSTLEDPVLKHFRAVVAKTYGDRLERVILYGSRARGDAQPDSDYDIAVFLHEVNDLNARWTEMDRLADISTALLEETGEFVHAMAYRAGSYNERTPLMHEIRREGIDL